MIKVSVLYPKQPDTKFDMPYYVNSHMNMVQRLLGPRLKGVAVEEGICGAEPGSSASYVAMGHLLFESVADYCCCDCCKGVCIVISDQGEGFDPEMVPDPLAVENLESEHGRGIHLMKLAMDEVSFEHGGKEVRMRKKLGLEQRKCASALLCRDT